jgi:hypothetical protein
MHGVLIYLSTVQVKIYIVNVLLGHVPVKFLDTVFEIALRVLRDDRLFLSRGIPDNGVAQWQLHFKGVDSARGILLRALSKCRVKGRNILVNCWEVDKQLAARVHVWSDPQCQEYLDSQIEKSKSFGALRALLQEKLNVHFSSFQVIFVLTGGS